MEKIWAIGITILIFLVITFLYWKLTRGYAKKEYGKKMWTQWGTRTFYWTGALMISGGLTVLIIFLLNSANILTF
ncbi:hypothetical protein GCM10023314_18160 [Algibacter agarivorans]|uniref:Uncharacterized protein n=1 Tax=Algibacter agarivorans TaxID=1109741 RepID=A0ABP9GJ37_9FLAO